MKTISYILLFAITTLTFTACSSCKVVKQSPILEIQFGYGGGATQKVETYKLNRKGEIFKGKERITRISQKDICDIYSHAETLGEPVNKPSNTFSFIRIITNEGVTYYCWDGITALPVTNMYLKLNNLLPK